MPRRVAVLWVSSCAPRFCGRSLQPCRRPLDFFLADEGEGVGLHLERLVEVAVAQHFHEAAALGRGPGPCRLSGVTSPGFSMTAFMSPMLTIW